MAKTKIHGEYLDPSVISTQTEVTAVGSDHMLIFDATDNALKKALLSDLIETVGSTPTFSQISSTGNLTIDAAGDIILDADGDDWKFHEGGNAVFEIKHESHGVDFLLNTTDEDWRFKGSDGGSTITALHLDISDGGKAIFNGGASFGSDISIASAGNGVELSRSGYDTYALQHSTGNGMAIYNVTDSRNEMHFAGDGNIGIGTTTPQNISGYRVLDVHGSTHGGIFQSKASGNQTARLYVTTAAGYVGTSSNDTFNILTNDVERMQFENNGQINLGIGQSHGYIPAYDQGTGYTNNLNAGSFGILHRNGYDSYITGNTYYYKTGGSAGWKAKYPAYKSGVLSMLDGRFQFDCSNAAPGGSGVVAVSGLAPVVRIDSDGLKFGSDSAAANALDDYEEGTFTPSLTPDSGSITPYTSYAKLGYTKVGRVVTITGMLAMASASSPSGALTIGNLPFALSSPENRAGLTRPTIHVYCSGSGAPTVNKYYVGFIAFAQNGTSGALFITYGSGQQDATCADFFAAGSDIFVNFSYITS